MATKRSRENFESDAEADVRFAISCCEWILKRQPADADAKKLLESCQERLARMKRIRPEPPLKHLHD